MYTIEEYGEMLADGARIGAYARALQQTLTPGATVLDLGAGTGILSLIACRCGARRVYAVEENDVLVIARQIAEANGLADRIVFLEGDATGVELPEKADVIVADLHGVMPFFGSGLAALADARRRNLASGGTMIPRRDSLWAAIVAAPETYEELVSPWARSNLGFDMQAARRAVTNCVKKAAVSAEQLLCEPQCWGTLDYAAQESPSHRATLGFRISRHGIGHGLVLWFDSVLAEGIELTNAPGKPGLIYGSLFLPWPEAVTLRAGDEIAVTLRADFTGTGYRWTWRTRTGQGADGGPATGFDQSTFWGSPPSRSRLRKRDGAHRPQLALDGRIDAEILAAMNGSTPLEDIARRLLDRFPARFRTFGEALSRAGAVAERYGEDAGN